MPRGARRSLLLALALTACDAKDPVILKLAGTQVRRSQFERHLAALEEHGLGPITPEARAGLLTSFLEQRALVIEAEQRKLLKPGASPSDEAEAVAQLLAAAVPVPEVSSEEIERWLAQNPGERSVPERVGLRQVLVGTLNEAREVKRRLAKEPRSFESLARSLSKGPEAVMGGYMGSFERGQLPPELEQAAFALEVGATSDPVQTPLGYHVLRVESRDTSRDISPDEAHAKIRDRLAREKRAGAERAFVAEIMARAKVNHEAASRPSRP